MGRFWPKAAMNRPTGSQNLNRPSFAQFFQVRRQQAPGFAVGFEAGALSSRKRPSKRSLGGAPSGVDVVHASGVLPGKTQGPSTSLGMTRSLMAGLPSVARVNLLSNFLPIAAFAGEGARATLATADSTRPRRLLSLSFRARSGIPGIFWPGVDRLNQTRSPVLTSPLP